MAHLRRSMTFLSYGKRDGLRDASPRVTESQYESMGSRPSRETVTPFTGLSGTGQQGMMRTQPEACGMLSLIVESTTCQEDER